MSNRQGKDEVNAPSRAGKQITGRKGEEAALQHLLKEGYLLRARNYRCRWGEIDIIVQRGEELVFVEVRSRKSLAFGMPQESISMQKKKRMRQVARYYLAKELGGCWKGTVRFDVIAIVFGKREELTFFEHFCAAFF